MDNFDDAAFEGDDMVNIMMSQLMDKETMYEPLAATKQKYLEWFEKHAKTHANQQELQRYTIQLSVITKILSLLDENDAEKLPTVASLFVQLRALGDPPAAIMEQSL